jgi:hypothetical protein
MQLVHVVEPALTRVTIYIVIPVMGKWFPIAGIKHCLQKAACLHPRPGPDMEGPTPCTPVANIKYIHLHNHKQTTSNASVETQWQ